MKEYGRKILTGILIVSFLVSLFMMYRQQKDKNAGHDAYVHAQQLAVSPLQSEPEPTETAPSAENREKTIEPEYRWIPEPIGTEDPHIHYLETIHLDTLRETNPDVLGWICIPDTPINHPLVQGEDNEYYLKRTWEGDRNVMGSIFLETENTPDFTDFNTIVYGHNMNDGSMFAEIKQYRDQTYAQQYPYVYILNDAGAFRYEIFAAYEADVESSTYGLSFNQEKTRINFLTDAAENSDIDMGIEPALTDRILTLSTCTGTGYSTRWVVQARLKMIYAPQ